jgi:PAS domain S-box-containing protein
MALPTIQILLVEDNPGDVRFLDELLREVTTAQFELRQVERLSDALQSLSGDRFDVILLDLSLPDSQGLDTFTRLYHQAVPAIPIIVLTGLADETVAISAMQAGAQDYLVKGQVSGDLLGRAIRYAIERKQTEEKIREQAALLDIATDAILVRGLDHRIVFWNKGAERVFGWSASEASGQDASHLLYKTLSPQLDTALHTVLERGEWQGELQKVTKAGKEIIVQSRWTLVRDEADHPASILTVDTDITETKRLEAQFLRTQRLESLGTLASGIAHDFNNILTPILATAQLLPLKLPHIDDQTRRLLELLEESARRGADLVKQILSFAKGAEGKRIPMQVGHLVLEVEKIIKRTFPKSIEIQAQVLTHKLWTINADATQIHQVLTNLCVNARDAMPAGGVLSLTAENLVVDQHYAQMNPGLQVGSYVLITVSDTGMGMSPEVTERIFEPFFTTKEPGKGTGLGLSTALGIVESHGGCLKVYSEVGRGSEFRVYLPTIEQPVAQPPQAPELPLGQGELILVVDDEAPIRELSQTALETYGYRVITAKDGVDAITLYAQSADDISLVLMDLMMPTMDGMTAIHTLQQLNPHVKVVVTSGLPRNGRFADLPSHPVRAFLSKPHTIQELLTILRQVLESD